MNKLLLGAISVLALVTASAASAADLPVKAPFVAAPAPWSWTGFYVGANVGGSLGHNPTTQTETEGSESFPIETFNMAPFGFVYGGQIGYNYQFAANWVAGLEVDFQGTHQRDSACLLECGLESFNTTQKQDWFGTARGRFGYTNGDWMYYVTAGGAWMSIEQSFSVTSSPIALSTSSKQTNTGWVIGAGIETHLWGPWTVKAEYLYMDLGSISAAILIPAGPVTVATESGIRDNIIRAGLNYKFN